MMRTKKNEYIQVDDKNNHYLMVKKDAIDDYAMYTFFDGKKKINPFNLWYENINRKNVIGLKFDPSMKEDPKYYNIYKGMNYKTTDDLDYSKIDGFLNNPDQYKPIEKTKIPDGSPIGNFSCDY